MVRATHEQTAMQRRLRFTYYAAVLAVSVAAFPAWGQVPDDIEVKLKQIGRVVAASETAQIYGPLLAKQSYAGVAFTRDQSYGPEPRNILDVAAAAEKSGDARPVLIYLPGGVGNKKLDYPGGEPFYDNILLVAVKNGMVGVNVERRMGAGLAWDAGGHDVSDAIAWVHKNIIRFGGDPNRVIIWGQSAGANALSVYLSHPNLYPGGEVGVRAAILMSGGYNLSPLKANAPNGPIGSGDRGAAPTAARAPAVRPQPIDPTVQLQRSNLEGLRALRIPLFVMAAELDPPNIVELSSILKDQLCLAGHCPKYQVSKGESHISQVMSVNTADTSVSGPVFTWIKSVHE
jgi:acetyl esterase/lipase